MQLDDLNSKPHGGKGLKNIIDRTTGARFYNTPVSVNYQLLCLDQFHGPTHINCEKNKKSDIKRQKYPMHAIVL